MADEKMRIWNAVAKTDPAHTKKVEFGRKFTSIDAHWQIMQATKQFGPIGEGWGYSVDHSTVEITPTLLLAIADVSIWWLGDHLTPPTQMPTSKPRNTYGPIRATCEMYGPKTYKGKIIPGEFVCDEDAPKKAMTDALTKGLSHLGFSADVFLGLFDDNRYVQKMEREFKDGAAGAATRAIDETAREITEQTGESRSTYQIAKDAKAAKPKITPKEWADDAILVLNTCATLDSVNVWWKVNEKALTALQVKDEEQYERVALCADDARSSLRAHL